MTQAPDNSQKNIVFVGQGVEYVFGALAARARARGLNVIECDFLHRGWQQELSTLEPKSFTLISSHHFYLEAEAYTAHHGFSVDMPTISEFISIFKPKKIIYIPHDLAYPIKTDEIGALKYVDLMMMPSDAFWWLKSVTNVVNCGWIKWMFQSQDLQPEFELALIPSEIPALLRKSDSEIESIYGPVLERRPAMLLPPFPGVERISNIATSYGATILDKNISVSELILRSEGVISSGQSSVLLESACAGRPTLCIRDSTLPDEIQRDFVKGVPGVRLDYAGPGLAWLDAVRCGEEPFAAPATTVKQFDLEMFWEALSD